jgi:ATP-binding cassette subfamily B protein
MLWGHLQPTRKYQFKLLVLFSLIVPIFEIFTLGSLVPFMGVLTTIESQRNSQLIELTSLYFGVREKNDFIILYTLIFCVFIVISMTARLILLRLTYRLCYAVGSDLSQDIYKRKLSY